MLKYNKFVNFNTGRNNRNGRKAARSAPAPAPAPRPQPRHEAISSTYVEVYLPEPEYVPMPAYLLDLFASTMPEETPQVTEEPARVYQLPGPTQEPALQVPAVQHKKLSVEAEKPARKITRTTPICLPGPEMESAPPTDIYKRDKLSVEAKKPVRKITRTTPICLTAENKIATASEPSLNDIFQELVADDKNCLHRW